MKAYAIKAESTQLPQHPDNSSIKSLVNAYSAVVDLSLNDMDGVLSKLCAIDHAVLGLSEVIDSS